MDGFKSTRLVRTDWYYVDEVYTTDECSMGLCKRRAYFEIGSFAGNVPVIRVCYMHISFAIEDIIFFCRRAAGKTRLKTIAKLKVLVPTGLKKGYEYGKRHD